MTTLLKEDVVRMAEEVKIYLPSGLPSDWDEGDYICSANDLLSFAILARADLVAENERLKQVQESALKVCAQLDEVVLALPFDYLDPPAGGDVSLGEQVSRMYSEVKNLRHECVSTRTALAAVEADNERLRALIPSRTPGGFVSFGRFYSESEDKFNDPLNPMCKFKRIYLDDCEKALAQPRDDSALREMIAGVYEGCARIVDAMFCDSSAIHTLAAASAELRLRALIEKKLASLTS